jgi:hypothetical protein
MLCLACIARLGLHLLARLVLLGLRRCHGQPTNALACMARSWPRAQFKSIPAEFKYCRDSNSLKILFHTPTTTDARIHFKGMFFVFWGIAQFCPPSVNHIPQVPVLPQHARAPQHLRHAVVGEGCQEANVVELAYPRMPPPLQWGDRYLCLLVEVHNQCRSHSPCCFTPVGGGDARCVQVDVITKAGESVTRVSVLLFALDFMRRALPLWGPSRPSPSWFSNVHQTSMSGRL